MLIPSLYGAVLWITWVALYALRLLPWQRTSETSYAMFLPVIACFVTSVLCFSPLYRRLSPLQDAAGVEAPSTNPILVLLVLHALGFVGIVWFIVDLAPMFGSAGAMLLFLGSEPHYLRWAGEGLSSPGVQLSYFGWLAIALTLRFVQQGTVGRRWLALPATQFLGNFIFIDRTRPVWILFTCALALVPSSRLPTRTVWRLGILAIGIITLLFVSIGTWIGKISDDTAERRSALPAAVQNVYLYGTCGLAYFDHLFKVEPDTRFDPQRVLYPALKALADVKAISHQPPSQILEPYAVPYETNVGTFLEPFYRDGGTTFAILGMLLCSFGFDGLALVLWRQRSGLSAFAAANLCFASFLSFFTPKIASFPLWFFCALGIFASLKRVAGVAAPRITGHLA